MFQINEDDMSIFLTRGDTALFQVSAMKSETERYLFKPGDVVRIKVFEKKACENVVLQKCFGIEEDTEVVTIYLDERDTKFGEVISKPKDYWYEIELNPFSEPQTIVGYDEDGAKVLKLFPEGADVPDFPIEEEDIPVVDGKLDLTSTRPIQNQVVAREVYGLRTDLDDTTKQANRNTTDISVERDRIDRIIKGEITPVLKTRDELSIENSGVPMKANLISNGTNVSLSVELIELQAGNGVFVTKDITDNITKQMFRPLLKDGRTRYIQEVDDECYHVLFEYSIGKNGDHIHVSFKNKESEMMDTTIDVLTYPLESYVNPSGEIDDAKIGEDGEKYDTLGSAIRGQIAKVKDATKGEPGADSVYIGSGEMPEDCNFQVDPEGGVEELNDIVTKDKLKYLEGLKRKILAMTGGIRKNNKDLLAHKKVHSCRINEVSDKYVDIFVNEGGVSRKLRLQLEVGSTYQYEITRLNGYIIDSKSIYSSGTDYKEKELISVNIDGYMYDSLDVLKDESFEFTYLSYTYRILVNKVYYNVTTTINSEGFTVCESMDGEDDSFLKTNLISNKNITEICKHGNNLLLFTVVNGRMLYTEKIQKIDKVVIKTFSFTGGC